MQLRMRLRMRLRPWLVVVLLPIIGRPCCPPIGLRIVLLLWRLHERRWRVVMWMRMMKVLLVPLLLLLLVLLLLLLLRVVLMLWMVWRRRSMRWWQRRMGIQRWRLVAAVHYGVGCERIRPKHA